MTETPPSKPVDGAVRSAATSLPENRTAPSSDVEKSAAPRLFQVSAGYARRRSRYQRYVSPFTAGIVVTKSGVIADAAPILKWTRGKQFSWFITYCQNQQWELTEVKHGT